MGATASASGNEPVDVGIGEADRAEWPGLESMLCDHCNKAGSKLLRCSACRGAFFCSRECQQAAWPRHKLVCGHSKSGANTPSLPGSPASSAPGSPREPGSAKKLFREGLGAFQQRRFRDALKCADEVMALASAEGSMELRCEALRLRGQCFEQLSDLRKAKETFAQALTEARGNLTGPASTRAEANALLRLGAVAKRSSKPGVAAQYQRKAVALLEADGSDQDTLAAAYNNLGISALQHGYEDEAQKAFERAFKLRKESGHVEGLVACSSNLANLLRSKSKPSQACSRLEEARGLARESGSQRLEQQVLLNLANLYENELPEEDEASSNPPTAPTATGTDPAPASIRGADATSAEIPARATPPSTPEQGEAPPGDVDRADERAAPDESSAQKERPTDPGTGPGSPVASVLSDISPSGKSEAAAVLSFPERALRCRRALFGLSEVPKSATKAPVATELLCTKCRSDLTGCKQLRCGRCRKVFYCSEACQRQDWKAHSQDCRPPPGPSPEELELRDRACPICLEPLGLLAESAPDKKISILQCLHCLHTRCWEECAGAGGAVCPVCRDNLGFSL